MTIMTRGITALLGMRDTAINSLAAWYYVAVILKVKFSSSLCRIVVWEIDLKLFPGEYHRTSLLGSQHCFR